MRCTCVSYVLSVVCVVRGILYHVRNKSRLKTLYFIHTKINRYEN